jgi:hypothetical protein
VFPEFEEGEGCEEGGGDVLPRISWNKNGIAKTRICILLQMFGLLCVFLSSFLPSRSAVVSTVAAVDRMQMAIEMAEAAMVAAVTVVAGVAGSDGKKEGGTNP